IFPISIALKGQHILVRRNAVGHDLFYIALSGRWILKFHDSHRVAVGWIMLPLWGVGNFIVNGY
ncbi:MAG: hypothetical protein LBQ66_07935, partial [Planctomycetaceae bacterium]|nr:hypothetical protein [Planctomycetaceae bacterium]